MCRKNITLTRSSLTSIVHYVEYSSIYVFFFAPKAMYVEGKVNAPKSETHKCSIRQQY